MRVHEFDTPEYNTDGPYNTAFHILNALVEMASYSNAPLTPELEKVLTAYLAFVKAHFDEQDASALSLTVAFALYAWGEGKYPSPV